MAPLPGRATSDGTLRFRDRAVRDRHLPLEHFREAPGGLWLSSLGIGTYIGAPDGPTDLAVEHAVTIALSSGRINVVDTAINYRYQRAERSVGRALTHLVSQGTVARDEMFIASKNGYFAPDAEARTPPDRWVEQELILPGVLATQDIVDGCHAMSPSYLADQFERSRRNLGLETIDLLYLHNAPDAQIPAVGKDAFLERLEAAFQLYEQYRDRGELGAYGLATWDCFRSPRTDPHSFSLEAAVRVARKVGGAEHGLRFVQFPYNPAMPEAARLRNQAVGREVLTLFDAARRFGIGCFTSVPLLQGRLTKAGPKMHGLSSAQTAIQFARSTPGVLAPLIGQKSTEHLSENLEVAARLPWGSADFGTLLS